MNEDDKEHSDKRQKTDLEGPVKTFAETSAAFSGDFPCVRMSFHGGGAHVWRLADVVALRTRRMAGELVGADLGFPAQNLSHGPPLTLAPEEVPIACEVLGVELPQTHVIDTLKARVFRELWQRGFWLAKGTSFGCDYLVYSGDPNVYHACYLLVIKPWDDACKVLTYVTVARLATTVKKLAVIGSQKPTGEFWFHSLKWLGT